MNTQAQTQKYGQFIAVGGMIVALISFFFIPFMTISYRNLSNGSSSSHVQFSSYTHSALQVATLQGFVWLEALLAGGILLVALLLAYSRNPFDMSKVPLARQVQRGMYALIGACVVSIVVQYIIMSTVPGSIMGMYSPLIAATSSSAGSYASTYANEMQSMLNSISTSYAVGSWFYLIGMLIAIGGEIYGLRATQPAATGVAAQVSAPYMPPVQRASAAWQQPSSPYQQDWQQPNQQPGQPAQEQYQPRQPWQPPQPPTEYR